jgi:hypothetical protein
MNSVFINDENFTLIDSNNDGEINVRGTIVIQENIEYNINGLKLNFTDNSDLPSNYPKSGIVVQPGADLSLENVELSSLDECSNIWGGIELWSNEYEYATVSVENSTFTNAKIAVSNISKYAYNNDISEEGGLIKMKNSTVINAKIGVNVIERLGQHLNHEILGNTFLNNENIISPTYIHLNGVEVISIKENVFNGSEVVNSDQRGTAIKGFNSSVNSLNVKPDFQNYSFNNTFNHLYIGVDLNNVSKKRLDVNIYNDHFSNVEKCIIIEGSYGGEIMLNEFNISKGSSQNDAFGIKTIGENNLRITKNDFFSSASINNYGIISESNANGNGLIKLNAFEGEFVNGINFIGANSFKEVSCNNFDINGQYDWFIYKNDSGQLGSLEIQEELNVNTFSDSNNVVYNLKNHHENQFFHYKDAYQYMPYAVCESITVEEISVTVNRDQFCFNEGGLFLN